MFSCPGLKVLGGNVTVIHWRNDLSFKLDPEDRHDLLSLDGAQCSARWKAE